MHIEILTEDASAKALLEIIMPKLCEDRFTFRVISYKGVGRIPQKLRSNQNPAKRILLDQLPRVIKGYDNTPGIDGVVVVLDCDTHPCKEFLAQLKQMVAALKVKVSVVFRLAIEETEAWLLGDRAAIKLAYPGAKLQNLSGYDQDGIGQTWEKLADVLVAGGASSVKKVGWPLPGQLKHEWATKIAPHFDMPNNQSPSFQKLRTYLLSLNS